MTKRELKKWLFRAKVSVLNESVELLSDYVSSKDKVKVKCKICGMEYYDTPSNILAGKLHKTKEHSSWCTKWSTTSKQRKNIVQKLESIANKAENVELYNYLLDTNEITYKCLKCNKVFTKNINQMYTVHNLCTVCTKIKSIPYNPDYGKRLRKIELLINNSDFIEYVSKNGSILKCECMKCGNKFEIEGYMNRKKINCPLCLKNRRNEQKANRRFELKNSEYTSIKRKCSFQSYCFIRNDFLCKDCIMKKKPYYLKSEFKDVAEKLNRNIEIIDDYIDSQTDIRYKCKKCGNISSAKPGKIISNGCGCKRCHSSSGEIVIEEYLKKFKIKYNKEFCFNDCRDVRVLRFDFYLPQFNIAIEYDGRQHYEAIDYFGGEKSYKQTVKHDNIKDEYCQKHDIKLIRIPYFCTDIYSLLDKELQLLR